MDDDNIKSMIPDYQTLMRPVLECAAKGEVRIRDVVNMLAEKYQLSEQERNHLLPSGTQRTFDNRVNWAKSYLKHAGLVKITGRGLFEITDDGRKALTESDEKIDRNYLERYDKYQEFKAKSKNSKPQKTHEAEEFETPDELLRQALDSINESLGLDLIDRVRAASPEFFEQLIVDLLIAMGYGGTSEDAGRALGQSGDDGIDGVIDQDPLGVDQIFVQAKRYKEGNNIGSGAMRDFYGALSLQKAQKGIFVTTSKFSSSAIETAKNLGTRIVLIDGKRLAALMVRYNIGCRDEEVLHLKKIDEDFFEPE